MVNDTLTAADMVPESTYLYDEPFLIVSHIVEDIGLVGWGNKLWTHKVKTRSQTGLSSSSAQASGWMQAFDPNSSKYYFYNTALGVTTWEEPEQDYQADETVEYYKNLGLAPAWERSTRRTPSDQGSWRQSSPPKQSPLRQSSPSKQSPFKLISPSKQSPSKHNPFKESPFKLSSPTKQSPSKQSPFRRVKSQEQAVGSGEHVHRQQVTVPATTTAGDQPKPEYESAARQSDAGGAEMVPACVRFAPKKKGDVPANVERYWLLRYSLFSRWGSGVYLDETSLFSVTPEVIAQHHARMLSGSDSVLDAFCGCGGNTIALAQQFDKVIACDIDAQQLEMARRNCEAYSRSDKVTWVLGDFFQTPLDKVDTVFLSPPWGGPGGSKDCSFDAAHALPRADWSVKDSIEKACAVLSDTSLQASTTSEEVPNVAVYLPRNTLMSSLRECLLVHGFTVKPLCLERNVLNMQLKAVTLYLRCSFDAKTDSLHSTATEE